MYPGVKQKTMPHTREEISSNVMPLHVLVWGIADSVALEIYMGLFLP